MPVQRVELIGRSFDDFSVTRQYYLQGPADEEEAILALRPLTQVKVIGFPYASGTVQEVSEIAGDWTAAITWGGQNLNTVEYRFSFTAPSAHITQSLATVRWANSTGNYTVSNDAANNGILLFDGAINVVEDGGKKRVEGIDLAPPPEVFTLTWAAEDGFITDEYQRIVEGVVGTVNAFDYRGRPAGSLLLSRVSGGRTGRNVWAIEFGFSYVANSVSIPVGSGIVVTAKNGHDLLWIYYGNEEAAGTGYDVVKKPRAAYVERVWPYSNFDVLQLPL